jgi:hypothetical protein
MPDKVRWVTSAEEEEMVSGYLAGESTGKIGRRLNRRSGTVWRVLARRKVPTRPHRQYEFNQGYFAAIDAPAKARWLGFIAADGCVRGGPGDDQVLAISLQRRDKGHLEAFCAAIGWHGPIGDVGLRQRSGKVTPGSRIHVCSVEMVRDLRRHGIGPRKSHTLEPWQGPPALQRFWWAGMVDGDGHLGFSVRENGSTFAWRISLVGSRAVIAAWVDFVRAQTGDRKSVKPKYNSFTCNYTALGTVQSLTALFYDGLAGSLPLCRKLKAAQNILSVARLVPPPLEVPTERLIALRAELGTWRAVADALGVSRSNMRRFCQKRGFRPPKQSERWADLTPERLEGLRQQHGSWEAVVRALGMRGKSTLRYIRRRLGML